MSRAIVKFSLDGDAGSKMRGRANKVLEEHGFVPYGTATMECRSGTQDDLLKALEELANVLRETDAAPVDNLCLYLD